MTEFFPHPDHVLGKLFFICLGMIVGLGLFSFIVLRYVPMPAPTSYIYLEGKQ